MRIFYLFCVLTLFSCSAKYHYQKAVKRGLKELISSDTIRITTLDSVPVIKHDTIVYEKFFSSKDTVILYKNIYVPQTRLETRIEYKLKRDTLRLIKRVEVQKARASKKTCWECFLIALLGLGLLVFVLFKLIQKYL
tara:strand:+ start:33 stop:443 length:411 start_codon:yes stop_codon:yes gene_type:complete